MRKNILILFCLLLVFAVLACNSTDNDIDGDSSDGDITDGDSDIVDKDLIDEDDGDFDYDCEYDCESEEVAPDGDASDGDESESEIADGDDDNTQPDGDEVDGDLVDAEVEQEIEGIRCEKWDDCSAANMDCESYTCDFDIGVCRCMCDTNEDCGDEICYHGYCVGCAEDAHCKELNCDTGSQTAPKCRVDTESCVCGGKCGDEVCDEAEEALGTCPQDCKACVTGQIKPFACMSGVEVIWCECKNSQWDCVEHPEALCEEQTDCARQGGQCVSDMQYCEGKQASGSLDCSDPDPICCLPDECGVAGINYYPYFGICCAGLVAIDTNALMENFEQDNPGLVCFANCWSQTCAPCGNGKCEWHFDENYCNCPEDCPAPPQELICSSDDNPTLCGTEHCVQDGNDCIQKTPLCQNKECSWNIDRKSGWVCNSIIRKCQQMEK